MFGHKYRFSRLIYKIWIWSKVSLFNAQRREGKTQALRTSCDLQASTSTIDFYVHDCPIRKKDKNKLRFHGSVARIKPLLSKMNKAA